MWKQFVDWLIYSLLKMPAGGFWANFLNFLIYDFFKILFMVFIIMYLVAFVRSYLSEEKLNNVMKKNFFGLNYLIAALFGALTPFCSCSSIPIFIGMVEAGVPLGVGIAFLVTSPIVNEVVVVLMGNYYGWGLALTYALSGIILGVLSGIVINRLNLDKELILKNKIKSCCTPKVTVDNSCCSGNCDSSKVVVKTMEMQDRLVFAWKETMTLLADIWKFILLGVAIGALIHNAVPSEMVRKYTGGNNWWTVPLAVVFGIPMYAGCSTIAPAIFSITSSGVELGTSLALLMAIAGLSLPEAMILKSSMSLKLLVIFYSIVAFGIIIVGYLFNYLF